MKPSPSCQNKNEHVIYDSRNFVLIHALFFGSDQVKKVTSILVLDEVKKSLKICFDFAKVETFFELTKFRMIFSSIWWKNIYANRLKKPNFRICVLSHEKISRQGNVPDGNKKPVSGRKTGQNGLVFVLLLADLIKSPPKCPFFGSFVGFFFFAATFFFFFLIFRHLERF